jgi:hypothetical protein
MIYCAFAFALLLQEGGLEILEGETLYQEGWLFTLSESYRQKGSTFEGDNHTRDEDGPPDYRNGELWNPS